MSSIGAISKIYDSSTFDITNVSIKKATIQDSKNVGELYKTVGITEKNIAEKLNLYNNNSFFKTGGIFQIRTEPEIIELFLKNEAIIVIAERKDTKDIIGAYLGYIEKNIFISLDILVNPIFNNNGLAKLLKLHLINELLEKEIKTGIIEIYTIQGFSLNGKSFEITLENSPSIYFNKKYFEIRLREKFSKIVKISEYKIFIESHLFEFDTITAYKNLTNETKY